MLRWSALLLVLTAGSPWVSGRTVNGLRIETQQKARVDFVLEPGSVTETVEVVASAVALTTENAAIGQVIENKRVVDLPLNGRNMIQLAVMVPGVQFGSRSGADGQGGFPIPGAGMSVIANGQREVHQSITLDGVESIAPLYNMSSFTPSIDAVEEFKVQTGSYSAEFGIGIDAKEAAGFGVLAHQTWRHRPANLPSATGAGRSVILGKISFRG